MKAIATNTFNLLRVPWIPCIDSGGRHCELGLIDLFDRARDLRGISDPSPLVRVSLHRLLLAILYRTQKIDTLDDWARIANGGWNAEAIRAYLEKWEPRFDLFSEQTPFFQRPDLDLADKRTPLSKFSPEYAAGNNKQLFDHSGDEEPPAMSFALAARLLLVCQGWSIGGGKAGGGRPNFTTAALPRGVCLLPLGRTLAETLTLNLAPLQFLRKMPRAVVVGNAADAAAWERSGSEPVDDRPLQGVADYLTWQYRYVRLLPESDGTVRFAYCTQGEKIAESKDAPTLVDPFHAYRKSETLGHMSKGLSSDRAAWRDAESLFAMFPDVDTGDERQSCVALLAVAEASNRHSLALPATIPVFAAGVAIPGGQPPPDLWCGDVFRVPVAILERQDAFGQLREAMAIAQKAVGVLRSAVHFYAAEFLKHDNGSFDKDAARKFADSLCREADYWAALEAGFHEFLPHVGDDDKFEDALKRWRAGVRDAAIEAFEASLASQDSTGRHLRALNSALGYFRGSAKGIDSIVPKEEGNG